MTASCRACEAPTEFFADTKVLSGRPATFNRCPRCGMVMAVDPQWLPEAYESAITKLDLGLLDRCHILANITAAVLTSERLRAGRHLDWAGGYGALTRMMRDRGYDFRHLEPYADNIFADGFECTDLAGERFDLVTLFEVLEHLEDPADALRDVAASTDLLLATTQLVPDPAPQPDEWWYYTLETGQHITLFTDEALQALARRLGFDGVVVGRLVHLFYRGRPRGVTRALIRRAGVAFAAGAAMSVPDRRRSLLQADLDLVKRQAGGSR